MHPSPSPQYAHPSPQHPYLSPSHSGTCTPHTHPHPLIPASAPLTLSHRHPHPSPPHPGTHIPRSLTPAPTLPPHTGTHIPHTALTPLTSAPSGRTPLTHPSPPRIMHNSASRPPSGCSLHSPPPLPHKDQAAVPTARAPARTTTPGVSPDARGAVGVVGEVWGWGAVPSGNCSPEEGRTGRGA